MVNMISIGWLSQQKSSASQPIVELEFRSVSDQAHGLARKVLIVAGGSLENTRCVTVKSLIDEGRPAADGPRMPVPGPGGPVFFWSFPHTGSTQEPCRPRDARLLETLDDICQSSVTISPSISQHQASMPPSFRRSSFRSRFR